MAWQSAIPWSLVIFRFLLGPALAVLARRHAAPEVWLGLLFTAGPVSDLFDGVLARRFGTATAALRIADTVVDIAFYGFVLLAVVEVNWPAVRDRIWLFCIVIAMEAAQLFFGFVKFRRMTSYHSYATRLWGVMMMIAFGTALGSHRGAWLLTIALGWGVLCEAEGLVFSALLPEWVHDVKTLPRALAIRRVIRERAGQVSAR